MILTDGVFRSKVPSQAAIPGCKDLKKHRINYRAAYADICAGGHYARRFPFAVSAVHDSIASTLYVGIGW
jgi:hypothetical protein